MYVRFVVCKICRAYLIYLNIFLKVSTPTRGAGSMVATPSTPTRTTRLTGKKYRNTFFCLINLPIKLAKLSKFEALDKDSIQINHENLIIGDFFY